MFPEARNLRNECRVYFNGIERQAEINNYAASRRLDLNAGAAPAQIPRSSADG